MFRTDRIALNDGNNIIVSSTGSMYDGVMTNYCYSEGATAPSTVLSTLSYCDEAMTKTVIVPSVFEDFTRHRTDEQLEDETYIATKNFIIANTVWLWGDLEHGGCFYYNGGVTGKCSLGACYGFLKDQNDDTLKYYSIIRAVDGFTRVESNEVAFSWNDLFLDANLEPSLQIWYINGGYRDESITDDSPYYGEWKNGYEYTNTSILRDMMGDCVWVSAGITQNRKPERVWNNRSANSSLILKSLNATITTSALLYGNILGDSDIDPDVNPSIKGGTSQPEGGAGDYPNRSDEVDFTDPDDYTVDAVNSGFITLYNPTKAEVRQFSDFLWTDITDNISQQIKRLIANPLDAVLFIAMCHFHPPTTGIGSVIKYCGISSGVSALLVQPQYYTVDCGDVTVGESFTNFLDYNPYSKAHIYLPYVGINAIDINDIMRSNVHVEYIIDLITGSALAQVKCTRAERREGDAELKAVLYEFPCNVYEQLPLTGSDWRAAVGNMISLISGAVGVATGNGAGLGAMASAVASQQVSVVRSGSATGNYGYQGSQKPYLILERPLENVPLNFPMMKGLVCNITYKLGNVRGYTEVDVDSWRSDAVMGTDDEMQEIKDLLNKGVFL